MMLELHNVSIGQRVKALSLTVNSGQIVTITGTEGAGKTTLLRAVLGLIAIDGGHISVDGELLTTKSAAYFRRQMAYVPQRLSMPEGYDGMGLERWAVLSADERYLLLLNNAVQSGRQLLIVDEPDHRLSADTAERVDLLLEEAAARGAAVLAVNSRINKNQIQL